MEEIELNKLVDDKIKSLELIPKKIAAIEAHRITKKLKILYISSIAAIFVCMILTTFNMWAGSVGALIASLYFGFNLFQETKFMSFLENKYQLGQRKEYDMYERKY